MEAGSSMLKSWVHLSILSWLPMSRDTSYDCSGCALFKGTQQSRKAEIPPMHNVSGSSLWEDAASAIKKDCPVTIYPSRLGGILHVIAQKEVSPHHPHTNSSHISLPYLQPFQLGNLLVLPLQAPNTYSASWGSSHL